MPGYLKIILILLFFLYFVSPYDFLPDLIPYLGRIDDALLLGLLLYVLKKGRLPAFLAWLGKLFRPARGGYSSPEAEEYHNAGNPGPEREDRSPYEVLGVSPGAGREEIQSAYREKVQAYHPDKVSHLGREFQELAAEKFLEIQKAYEELTGKGA